MILLKNNYYEEDERLFSTGDEELDDILEEVYYSGIEDGYDYFQKEFDISIKGLKNKVKGSIRHLKRDYTTGKIAGKTITKQNLSPEEVHRVAVNSRAVLIPGSKASKQATKKRFIDARTGKIRTATRKELEQTAAAWNLLDQKGQGAVSTFLGYL